MIKLNEYQANEFARDYFHLRGGSYFIKGEMLQVSDIVVQETDLGTYIPVVYFETHTDWNFVYSIISFLNDIGEKYDLSKYENQSK
jgi:hypothetical protein